MNTGLGVKQLGLLHQLLHRDARFAVLVNPKNPQTQSVITDVQAAASAMGQQLEILTATTNRDISPAFSDAVRKRADALLISADPLFATVPCNWPRWRHVMRCRRSMPFASLPKPAG